MCLNKFVYKFKVYDPLLILSMCPQGCHRLSDLILHARQIGPREGEMIPLPQVEGGNDEPTVW